MRITASLYKFKKTRCECGWPWRCLLAKGSLRCTCFFALKTHCGLGSISAKTVPHLQPNPFPWTWQRCVACVHTLAKQPKSQQFLVNFWLFTSGVISSLASFIYPRSQAEDGDKQKDKGTSDSEADGREKKKAVRPGQSRHFWDSSEWNVADFNNAHCLLPFEILLLWVRSTALNTRNNTYKLNSEQKGKPVFFCLFVCFHWETEGNAKEVSLVSNSIPCKGDRICSSIFIGLRGIH